MLNGMQIAVKQLKSYSPRFAPSIVKRYEKLFTLTHNNIVKVLGVCPQAGQAILEYFEKHVDDLGTLHTLSDLLLHLGSDFPQELKLNALADVAEALLYLHDQGIIHGDIKPANILVSCKEVNEYNFKITDYSCNSLDQMSSRSSSLKQLMTPRYMAPELFTDRGICLQPTITSDIYSFEMLTYEVIFQQEPWSNVSMQLINAVRSGFRPVIPDNSPQLITKITELCWQHDYNLWLCASQVLQMLEEAMKTLDSVLNSSALPVISHGSDTDCDIDNAASYSTSTSFGTTVVSHASTR